MLFNDIDISRGYFRRNGFQLTFRTVCNNICDVDVLRLVVYERTCEGNNGACLSLLLISTSLSFCVESRRSRSCIQASSRPLQTREREEINVFAKLQPLMSLHARNIVSREAQEQK